jgi:hypothetical protein
MMKAVFWAAAIFAAALFLDDARALSPEDVARIMCCCDKAPSLRGCRSRFRRSPSGCRNDFGLSVQG